MKWFKKIIFLLFFLGSGVALQAQKELNYGLVEQKTLQYYLLQQWDSLNRIGNRALRAGIDSYALRYRLGEAAFKQRKYWKSIRHFEKALTFNTHDPYSQEFLFYSYLYNGRPADAWLCSKPFGRLFYQYHQLNPRQLLEYINLEGGLKNSNIVEIKPLGYGSVGMSHRPGLRWRYYHSISYLQQRFLANQIEQYEYFGSLHLQAAKGIGIYLSGHYLNGGIDRTVPDMDTGPFARLHTQIEQKGWVGAAGLEFSAGRWTISPFLGGSHAPVHTRTTRTIGNGPGNMMSTVLIDSTGILPTWQGGVDLLFRLHPAIRIGVQPNVLVQNDSIRYFFGAQLQWLPAGRWSFGVHYLHEPLTDYFEAGGAVFDNGISIMRQRLRGQAGWQVSKHLYLYGMYQWENREFEGRPFFYHTFITGINFIL
ncbi:MAG: tetratricopeptide repeat protein [Lewinellaceae bacterium]|nr:tetratricopeptide repeat protein [Lewinellaceae bacterium]